jgi:cytochrome c2
MRVGLILLPLSAVLAAQDPAPAPGALLVWEDARSQPIAVEELRTAAFRREAHAIPEGAVSVRLEGGLRVDRRERASFGLAASGPARLWIGGEDVLALGGPGHAVSSERRLQAGIHPFRIRLEGLGAPAEMRLDWEGRDFQREPISPERCRMPDPAQAPIRDLAVARGRELARQLRCQACHPAFPAPEASGPDLRGLGERLEPGFVARWLQDPRSLRRDARMPDVLGSVEPAARADLVADLVAFLVPGEASGEDEPAPSEARVREGARLFADLECIGCHLRPDDAGAGAGDRIPLQSVARKFRAGRLQAFLRAPSRHHPATRMPDFLLEEEEARALAAFLRTGKGPEEAWERPPAGDPARGARAYAERGCVHCHGPLPGSPEPGPAGDRSGSCLAAAAAARGGAPDFHLGPGARADLEAYAATRRGRALPDAHPRTGREWLLELRCQACHAVDGAPEIAARQGGETEVWRRAPEGKQQAQLRPSLSHAGWKLQGTFVQSLLEGRPGTRVRPWLAARMPAFPVQAAAIAEALAADHGLEAGCGAPAGIDPLLVPEGRLLIGKDGFACTACHAYEGQPPYAEFEVGAIALDLTRIRLRRGFYDLWMRDPRRFDPASRMPVYADGEGRSQIQDVLDGDLERQFAAIWAALHAR